MVVTRRWFIRASTPHETDDGTDFLKEMAAMGQHVSVSYVYLCLFDVYVVSRNTGVPATPGDQVCIKFYQILILIFSNVFFCFIFII